MKHRIRLKEPLKGEWQAGEVQELDCELGSGILDKNGREIFEGDKVEISFAGWVWFQKVHFRGAFYVGDTLLNHYLSQHFEIVD